MPRFSIDVTDAQLARLQAVVLDYNANNGTALTVQSWIDLHLKELAIGAELAASIESLQKQAQTDLQAAALAERQRLLASIK